MIDLIRKRHAGDGWQVFTELANGTGWKVKGWADAAALGIWPSRGYEFHGYECKISREDLKKELLDPSKADNVGKYCDFWWLVLADAKLMDGLVVPSTWGILVPRGGVLRTVRKAPKLEAKAFDRAFCAAMIRNVTSTWVPKHEHDELKKTAREEAEKKIADERRWEKSGAEADLADLKRQVDEFERESGVKLGTRWETRNIARAVAAVLKAREAGWARRGDDDPVALVRGELAGIERGIGEHQRAIGGLQGAAVRVRQLIELMEQEAAEPRLDPGVHYTPDAPEVG